MKISYVAWKKRLVKIFPVASPGKNQDGELGSYSVPRIC